MRLSVIIPAFNEESYLPPTLDAIQLAVAHLRARTNFDVELIVVDNNSQDETGAVARARGAKTIHEPVQGIARARNSGARRATGDTLVFIDADVILPPDALDAICRAMSDPTCVGGAMDVDYRPERRSMRLYLRAWRLLARLTGMAQGATQFCRRSVFDQVGGYDEKAWIGEDVDFFTSLRGHARAGDGTVAFIRSPRVQPSCRRFDKWPIWKVLVWTNPLFIVLFRRWKKAWSGWYSSPVR